MTVRGQVTGTLQPHSGQRLRLALADHHAIPALICAKLASIPFTRTLPTERP